MNDISVDQLVDRIRNCKGGRASITFSGTDRHNYVGVEEGDLAKLIAIARLTEPKPIPEDVEDGVTATLWFDDGSILSAAQRSDGQWWYWGPGSKEQAAFLKVNTPPVAYLPIPMSDSVKTLMRIYAGVGQDAFENHIVESILCVPHDGFSKWWAANAHWFEAGKPFPNGVLFGNLALDTQKRIIARTVWHSAQRSERPSWHTAMWHEEQKMAKLQEAVDAVVAKLEDLDKLDTHNAFRDNIAKAAKIKQSVVEAIANLRDVRDQIPTTVPRSSQ